MTSAAEEPQLAIMASTDASLRAQAAKVRPEPTKSKKAKPKRAGSKNAGPWSDWYVSEDRSYFWRARISRNGTPCLKTCLGSFSLLTSIRILGLPAHSRLPRTRPGRQHHPGRQQHPGRIWQRVQSTPIPDSRKAPRKPEPQPGPGSHFAQELVADDNNNFHRPPDQGPVCFQR